MVVTTPPSSRIPRASRLRTEGTRGAWWRWLVFGICFGLGYGLTQRLSHGGSSSGASGSVPSFAAQDAPGTRLSELQKRSGAQGHSLLGDLERLADERRQERQRQEDDRRQANLEQEKNEREDAARREADRVRLEALNHSPDPVVVAPEPILLPSQDSEPARISDPASTTTAPPAAANPP